MKENILYGLLIAGAAVALISGIMLIRRLAQKPEPLVVIPFRPPGEPAAPVKADAGEGSLAT